MKLAGLSHQVADVLSTPGCGYTLDVHRGDSDGGIVQWLWGEPLDGDETQAIDRGRALFEAVKAAGVSPGDTAPYDAHLTDVVIVMDECPFQPAVCSGRHLVASGRGRIGRP